MKKYLVPIAFFFAICALFHTQIVGAIATFTLKMKYDCDLAYRSLDWEDGELIFSDLILFDPSFHARIKKGTLRLDFSSFPKKLKGHLQIDSPQISLLKKRELPSLGGGWFDFTVSVDGGTLDWEGPLRFSLHGNQLVLNWEDSAAVLSRSEGKWEAELNQFKAKILQPWVPLGDILDGHLTGRIALSEERELISANLKVAHIGIRAGTSSIENMDGTLSYNAALGGKWELQGLGNAQEKTFPFTWEGRGFFKSHWVESEIWFPNASCEIAGADQWTVRSQNLSCEQLALLQAGAARIWPELGDWELKSGRISGQGTFSRSAWSVQWEGEGISLCTGAVSLVCDQIAGDLMETGGSLVITAPDYDVRIEGAWGDWNGSARWGPFQWGVHGGWDGEKCPIQIQPGKGGSVRCTGQGWIDPKFDFSFVLGGSFLCAQREISFACPQLSKRGSDWVFDVRLTRPSWDFARLAGTFNGEEFACSEKSHCLGSPIHFASSSIRTVDAAVRLPWTAVLSASPLLKEWGLDPTQWSGQEIDLHFRYADEWMALAVQGALFTLSAERLHDEWTLDLQSDLTLQAKLQKGGRAKGKGSWKSGLAVEFEGTIDPLFRCDFFFPKVEFDLAQLADLNIEGKLEGTGNVTYDGHIGAHFDFSPSPFKIHSYAVQNRSPLHLDYSSKQGALFHGIDLHGDLNCIVDSIGYDVRRKFWTLRHAQGSVDGIDFIADLDCASDFSTLNCTVHEGIVPFHGASYHIQNLHIFWNEGECQAILDALCKLNLHVGETLTGRLVLGQDAAPLTIDWEYQDALSIHSIEGSFGGLEASFHAETSDTLIGSARIDFHALSQFLPADIAEVFEEIKMGKGYEIKGRLKIENNTPSFQGILCGKQIELFGFQFRTLLGQVDLSPERIRIYDVKISDTAGSMKIEDLLIAGSNNRPWTLSIPTLSIFELRPSLLQRPGGPVGPISPLVVRELTLTNFQGILDDSKTYKAKGNLHFINSYKREETLFDLPANVLSRIVGLDLELLIPVTGDLDFELKNGLFHLTELTHAYSEGKRSEFFLEMDPEPSMDLDGNLHIFIKMKQFVLFKITESFLISVDGQLDNPQFRLKKRSFFGLL